MIEETVARAENVCKTIWSEDCSLQFESAILSDPGYRHLVIRCAVNGTDASAPHSVIVKRSRLGGGHIFREWAALAFLDELECNDRLTPAFFGGDQELELIVLEDLGDLEPIKLKTILYGRDPEMAAQALIESLRVIGTLQARTMEHMSRYDSLRQTVPAPSPIDFHQRGALYTALENLPHNMELLNVVVSASAQDEISVISKTLMNPGPFLSLVHGDCCPSNIAITDRGVRLYDFEVAEPGHALLDGAYARIRHLNCMDGLPLPLDIQKEMERAYREALSQSCPLVLDDQRFHRELASACLAWLAVSLSNLPRVLSREKQRGPATYRQRILASLEAAQLTLEEFQVWPSLCNSISQCHTKASQLWAEETESIDQFPAFRD